MLDVLIQRIDEIDLTNYIETIWHSGIAVEKAAPLLAKYRIDLLIDERKLELFFEVREQSNGVPLIDYFDEYFYDSINSVLTAIRNEKVRREFHNSLVGKISSVVFDKWRGQDLSFPMNLSSYE